MSTTQAVMPVYYIRQVADLIASMGVDIPRWLESSGLTEAQLSGTSVSLSWEAFRKLILDAFAVTEEPAMGLLLGERLLASMHGILGYAAMSSSSVRQVIELLERFIPLRTTLITVKHKIVDDEVQIHLEEAMPLGDVQHFVFEAITLALKNVLDFITLGSCQVRRIIFPFAAEYDPSLVEDLFQCEVSYEQTWAGFTLPLSVLDEPLKMADPSTFQDAENLCQQELDKLTQEATVAARVRRLMLERQSGFPSMQVTARIFHMTPRTLHRRLSDEGTSFQEVLDDVRHMLAIEHLKSGRITLQEIAYKLGYTETANFRRAFKRWESIPPSEYRAQHMQT